jgi:hypothetical protein
MAAPFTRVELARAVEESRSWTETVRRLGYAGNNTRTVRKYAASWEVSTDHFDPDAARKEAIGPRFTEEQLREAVAGSLSVAEALRRLGYCHTGGNPQTLKKYVGIWGISTDHFDPEAGRRRALEINGRSAIPLEQVLVEGSSYHRGHLKERLFEAGLKDRRCELCGQGDTWRGRPMSLVLDHINGVSTDNRLENLRLVCPNCAATRRLGHSDPQMGAPVRARARDRRGSGSRRSRDPPPHVAQPASRPRSRVARPLRSCETPLHPAHES